jgi:hypothetical protein
MVTIQPSELAMPTYAPVLANCVVWDLETGPLPWGRIESVIGKFDPCTVDLSEIPGGRPFDPSSVKPGNRKGEKLVEFMDEARERHRQDELLYEKRCTEAIKAAKVQYKSQALEKAALCATTCRILVSGFLDHGQHVLIEGERSEPSILHKTWSMLAAAKVVVGFNILGFDLPVMFRRSKILGVPIPPDMLHRRGGRIFWDERFIDLLEIWRAGTREWIDLGKLARALGVGDKNGSGGEFAELYATDRAAALEYARNDLNLTASVAEALL